MMTEAASKRSTAGFLVCILIIFTGLVALGIWQVQRLGWKERLIAAQENAQAAPPVLINDINDEVAAGRRVILNGTWIAVSPVPVGPITFRGQPGWYVITPLRLRSGAAVLVNRGWVDRRDQSLSSLPQGLVTVKGYLRRPGPRGMFTPANEPDANQWFFVEPQKMAAHLKLSNVADFWIVAARQERTGNNSSGPVPVGAPETLPNNHLQYAGTWFGLALVTLVMGVIYWCRRR